MRGICRAVGGRLTWLLGFIGTCFEALPNHLHVQPVTYNQDVMIRRLEVEADAMASFVQKVVCQMWRYAAREGPQASVVTVGRPLS